MMRTLRSYRYELIAASSGAIVMILELVGARVIAPYFGSSLYVWTAMIGVVLAALSAGYWYGGKLADREPSDVKLMKIIVMAAIAIAVSLIAQEALLGVVASITSDIRLSAVLAATILFAPAALLLGIVSPYVARLNIVNLQTAGQSIGRLYAAGTVGSIAGTFLAGYWLIALFGNRTLGVLLVIALVILSFVVYRNGWWIMRALAVSLTFAALYAPTHSFSGSVLEDVDSVYGRYFVTESNDEIPLRTLITDVFGTQSAQYVGQPDILVSTYTQRFKAISDKLQPSAVLVVGGGAYTYPLAASRAYPNTQIDVVEIDPKLTELAQQYFGFKQTDKLRVFHEDGRVFLNNNRNKYDIIYMDAYSSLTPPYQLATVEALREQRSSLSQNGLVVANIIARPTNDPYLTALVSSYKSVFNQVNVYPQQSDTSNTRQNMLLVATNSSEAKSSITNLFGASGLAVASSRPFTDDFAPVEQLINR